jgi:hypothetical protein
MRGINVVGLGVLLSTPSLFAQSGHCAGTVWVPPITQSINSFGSIQIPGRESRLEITVAPTGDPLRVLSSSCATEGTRSSATMIFKAGSRQIEANVNVFPGSHGDSKVAFSADQVSIASLTVARWPSSLRVQAVVVPYYTSPIAWLPDLGLFSNIYWNWTTSNATRIADLSATYGVLTNGLRNSLREELVVKFGAKLDDVLPDIPNPRSAYLASVAGRTVLDIWEPSFARIAATLTKLQTAGLKNCVVLIHVWQHSGYDNGLPGHYPANVALGGDSGLVAAVQAGKAAGCYVGLHENYVDYYPDYAQFDSSAVALNDRGQKQTAWYNPRVPIQSFATRPTIFVSTAETQSPEIHRRYQTSASFIDVNSSVFPWWRSDMDATAPGAAMFRTFVAASAALWNFERVSHDGPVFGEGNRHWFWSGLLDGVEAQFGAVNTRENNPEAPLFVDFDLLKIHPLQVNHGMGYYDRWVPRGQDIRQTTMLIDAYRMQEIAYGHAPFVGAELWDNPAQVVIEQNLVGSVATRYGTETASSIQYEIGGKWSDTNSAVEARDWSRVQIQYSNGDTVVANSRGDTLKWHNFEIPQNGWVAIGPGLLAYTAMHNGQLVDYSETGTSWFANSRNENDLESAGSLAQPVVQVFRQTGDRSATVEMKWTVLGLPAGESLNNFIHFVRSDGSIAFQADHYPSVPTSAWIEGQNFTDAPFLINIPPGVADGTYSMRVGLYSKVTGNRIHLAGSDDGTARYVMGNLVVANSGKALIFQPANGQPPAHDRRLNPAGAVIDFGSIQTDGMVSLSRSGSGWTLRVYPTSRNVTVRLNAGRFPPPGSVTCEGVSKTAQTPKAVSGYWTVATKGANDCRWQR